MSLFEFHDTDLLLKSHWSRSPEPLATEIAAARRQFPWSAPAILAGRWVGFASPDEIPDPEGRTVVFACRSGKRSVTASLAAQAGGKPYDSHLAGGMLAWKAAGLPSKTGG